MLQSRNFEAINNIEHYLRTAPLLLIRRFQIHRRFISSGLYHNRKLTSSGDGYIMLLSWVVFCDPSIAKHKTYLQVETVTAHDAACHAAKGTDLVVEAKMGNLSDGNITGEIIVTVYMPMQVFESFWGETPLGVVYQQLSKPFLRYLMLAVRVWCKSSNFTFCHIDFGGHGVGEILDYESE